jgi:short-subunit dehydrogenase
MPRPPRRCANINFTGCVRVIGAALPAMVARDKGHIVITGSLSGFRGLPGAIGYAASKAGTMVLAESLYADLRKTGVTVQLANPGFIQHAADGKERLRDALHHGCRQGRRDHAAPHGNEPLQDQLSDRLFLAVPGRTSPAGLALLSAVPAKVTAKATP